MIGGIDVETAIRTFVTSVVRTEEITRGVRQLTFGGGGLESFTPAAPDQFLYVLAPPPGERELTIDTSFTWEQYAAMPPSRRPVGAYYTVRRWRPGELDMLFVLHGDPSAPAGCGLGGGGGAGRPGRAVGTSVRVRAARDDRLVPTRGR